MAEPALARLAGIDCFRYLLCFAVALLHALPGVEGRVTTAWAVGMASICRAAVPFFFVAGGYFLKAPARWNRSIVAKPVRRLLPVYIAWCLLYGLFAILSSGERSSLSFRSLLTGGNAFHLWFIPVLGLALALVPSLVLAVGQRTAALMVGGAALLGLAFGAYHDVLHLPEARAIRLTMAPALVLIGYVFARYDVRLSAWTAALSVAVALTGAIGEELGIAALAGAPLTSHDIVVSTYALGAATFLLAKALGASGAARAIAPLGRISLGVYAAHLLFLDLLFRRFDRDLPLQTVALAVSATLLATGLSLLLDRIPLTRRLVR